MENNEQLVVSLTSFPGAIKYAAAAVRSILEGSLLPDKLVLYVTNSQFEAGDMPEELLKMEKENEIFEIRNYSRDIRSYRKLIPALRDFPKSVIVTIDDDVRYDRDMLKSLWMMHLRLPDYVIANRAKIISKDKPYRKWKKLRWYHFINNPLKIDFRIMQTGVAGVLYPPGALNPKMLDERLFNKLAPTTDDIWFWAATVSNGRTVIPVPFGPHNKPKETGKPKELSLKTINFKSGANRNEEALKAILEKYPSIENLLH